MADDIRRKLLLHQLDAIRDMDNASQTNKPSNGIPDNGDITKDESHEPSQLPSWDDYFAYNEKWPLQDRNCNFNVYYTLPTSYDGNSTPIYIFHHGAGSSGLSFANTSKQLSANLNGKCAYLAFDARGHGQTTPIDNDKPLQYYRKDFILDFLKLIDKFIETKIPQEMLTKVLVILVGHSMGGSICTFAISQLRRDIRNIVLGVVMLDIVEEAAKLALQRVSGFLQRTPNVFKSYEDAITWHLRNGLCKYKKSAEVVIPSLFREASNGKVERITELESFKAFWDTWFDGLSHEFVTAPTCKMLILAGNDNLDKELIFGQMQGKYQLVVFQDSGHFIQEDTPLKTALTLIEFWKRNDNKSVVIKTNWGSK